MTLELITRSSRLVHATVGVLLGGVAYRAAFGAETPRLVNDNLSGVSGGLVFKFGSF